MAQVPVISSFSPDSGNPDTTDQNVLSFVGTAPDNSTVDLYSGSTLLGTTTASSTGAWSITTPALTNGTYSFTATDIVSGITSATSAPLIVNVVPAAIVTKVAVSPGSGTEFSGDTMTMTVDMTAPVTVTGTPTLTLNNGGTATFSGGSGTNALTFSYTVAASQNTASLAAVAVNLNSATVTDGAGNAANLSLTGLTQSGPATVTAAPLPSVALALPNPPSVPWGTGKQYWVSPNGSDAADGLSPATAFKTLQQAESVSNPGDVVNVLPGTYTAPNARDVLQVNRAGSATGWITYKAAPGAKIQVSPNNWMGVEVLAPYTIVEGFEIVGNARNVTMDFALQHAHDGTIPQTNSYGVGIAANHVRILDNTIHDNSGHGIGGGGDYVVISGNNVYGNGNWSPYATGGVSQVQLGTRQFDNAPGYHDFITDNWIHDNVELIGNMYANGAITDGNGIIIDSNQFGFSSTPYTGRTLISNNVLTNNGAAGVHVFQSAHVDVFSNTSVNNNLNVKEGEIEAASASDVRMFSNIMLARSGSYATGGYADTNVAYDYNVDSGPATYGATPYGPHDIVANPLFGNGNWTPIGAVQTSSGYEVAWQNTSTGQYTVWTTDSSGNYTGTVIGAVAITFTLNLGEAVTVSGGTPTLTLNDGGTATYSGGSGTSALTFSYIDAAGRNTSPLAATAINLNSATITDGAGNSANLSLSSLTESGPQIETLTPTITSLTESPSSGNLNAGKTVTLSLNLNEAVTVAGGTPTLTLNDGGTATFSGGSGTNALTFSYTVAAGQNTSALTATAINLNSATITNGAGTAANLSLTGLTQSGPQIDTVTPTITSLAESPTSGDLNAGKTVTFSLNLNEAVTVAGGTPTLTLNDGGTATFSGGSGTNALTFSYTVATGQNTSALAATAINLNSATATNGAGTAANLSLSSLTQAGPQINTAPPPAPILVSDKVISKRVVLSGTEAENGTVISVYDGTTLLGTTTTSTKGAWVFETGHLANGARVFTATATDPAGNISGPSAAYDPNVGAGPTITAAPIDVGNQTYIYNSNGSGIALSYAGNGVTDGEFRAWIPIAATQAVSGYDVAWQNTVTGQYTVWSTDSNGNYSGNLIGAVSGNSYALESFEPVFNQDLNGDGVTGLNPLVIQADTNSFGSTSLAQIANNYFLFASGGTTGPELQYNGAAVAAGQFGKWNPIGTVKTANGYEVAWQNSSTSQYTVWTTDSNGNYNGNLIGAVAGNSYALESLEPVFQQDMNGDGVAGLKPLVIRTDTNSLGSTSLAQIANNYFLFASGGTTGPELQYNGAAVAAGQFGKWNPIGTVKTANGYEVAWQNSSTGQYTVWTTDSNGNYSGNLIGAVAGNSYALESLEPVFQQDLNGDGVAGLKPLVIRTDTNSLGSTSLAQIANNYFLFASGGTTGPELQYNGAAVAAGQFGNWNPIGTVKTANGYEVAWQNSSTGQYTVWTTDSNGNYNGNLIGAVSGNSYGLESLEPVFNQDLNGDGNVGLYAASGTILQISQSLSGASGAAIIGATATLELAAADSASVTFAASTGTLKLDQPSTFSGVIFNFAGDGSLSGSDQIDLKGINYNNTVQDSYTDGALTVADGSGNSAKLNFSGSYSLGNFSFANDGSGGAIVYDPPLPPSSSRNTSTVASAMIGNSALLELPGRHSESVTFDGSQGTLILDSSAPGSRPFKGAVSGFGGRNVNNLPGIAFDAQTTLGFASNGGHSEGTLSISGGVNGANMALLGHYMASSFGTTSDNHGGTMVPSPPVTPNDQTLLCSPHHP